MTERPIAETEWWCWCGNEQAEDGHCEGDLFHIYEDEIRAGLAKAIDHMLDDQWKPTPLEEGTTP